MAEIKPSKKTIKNLEELRKKQNKAIYNFNYRNKNNAPKIETVKKKELFKKIESGTDIKNIRKELKTPLDKKILTTDEGAKITVGEYKKLKHEVQVINKRREKQKQKIEEIEVTLKGENIGIKRGQMDDERTSEFRKKPFDVRKKSSRELEKYKETVQRELEDSDYSKRDESFKINYILSLEENGFSEEMIQFIRQVPTEFLIMKYYSDENINIKFNYNDHIETQIKENYIFNALKDYVDTEKTDIPDYWL